MYPSGWLSEISVKVNIRPEAWDVIILSGGVHALLIEQIDKYLESDPN
jgi:hypothetical protein